MFRNVGSKLRAVGLAAVGSVGTALVVPGVALAQTAAVEFDPAPVMEIVTNAQLFIVTIGLGVLILLMVAKGIKWARKAG